MSIITSAVSLAMSVSTVQNQIVHAHFMEDLARNVSADFQEQRKIDERFYKAI